MKTDSFSKEKHLPVRRFIADESKVATGLYGPFAIADDIDNIHAMFDPEADILGGEQKGGIGEQNIQDFAVSYKKLNPDLQKKIDDFTSKDELTSITEALTKELSQKVEKATTLSGYGITDAYTKEEVSDLLSKQQNVEEMQRFREEVTEELSHKMEATVLYEGVVNTPVWENQPSVSGDVSVFQPGSYYYVTLNDADKNPLPQGTFMLKDSFEDTATVYSPRFTLNNLNTGMDTLAENVPVEFTGELQLRDAGVTAVSYAVPNWNFEENAGCLQITVHGEFIQRNAAGYFLCQYETDKNVEAYHSTNGTTAFQQSAGKQIVPYSPLGGTVYGKNRIYDNCTISRNGKGYFSLRRDSVIKYSSNKVKTTQVFGYGNGLDSQTCVTGVIFYSNDSAKGGVIRNGSFIRISEVK